MTFTIVFIVIISSLIFFKLRDVSLRNNLNVKDEKRLLIAGGLVVLFLITNMTLPYPQSLYWFIFLGVILIGSVICSDIIKKELIRFKNLKTKDMVVNILFYSLFITVIHLYI
ncbi:hypothetical protein [Winogradskyella sp.]|uniref:hypothetical protein n=1 Tax=Winogradskyella sp. TaxID=1883156 RepID=UPI0025DE0949|nr:hypothetical protein [Winogradskyella sp.]